MKKRVRLSVILLVLTIMLLSAGCGMTSGSTEEVETAESAPVITEPALTKTTTMQSLTETTTEPTPLYFDDYGGIIPTLAVIDPTVTFTIKTTEGGHLYTFSKKYDTESEVLADMAAWAAEINKISGFTANRVADPDTNALYRLYMVKKDGKMIGGIAGFSDEETGGAPYTISFSCSTDPA